MGLYTIPCRQCNTMFLWFSGLMDQRCPACKEKDVKHHACMRQEQRAVPSGSCPCCGRCRQCGETRPHRHEDTAVVFTDVVPVGGFLFETCTKCGRRKRYPGPVLGTEPCKCDNDNETIGTPQP